MLCPRLNWVYSGAREKSWPGAAGPYNTALIDFTERHQWIMMDNQWTVWVGGRVVWEPDLRSTGRGFESRPPRCRVKLRATCLHTHVPLSPSSIIWCQPMSDDARRLGSGEVTADLAESNGSLPPGLWLWSPASSLPKTGINSGTLSSFRVCYYLPPFSDANND